MPNISLSQLSLATRRLPRLFPLFILILSPCILTGSPLSAYFAYFNSYSFFFFLRTASVPSAPMCCCCLRVVHGADIPARLAGPSPCLVRAVVCASSLPRTGYCSDKLLIYWTLCSLGFIIGFAIDIIKQADFKAQRAPHPSPTPSLTLSFFLSSSTHRLSHFPSVRADGDLLAFKVTTTKGEVWK